MGEKGMFFKNSNWANTLGAYPIHQLENEYDYESDEEQVYEAKKLHIEENSLAIEFFVKDDPLYLVENLKQENFYH